MSTYGRTKLEGEQRLLYIVDGSNKAVRVLDRQTLQIMGSIGGHAGHNGLRDIHAQLGTPDYWRLRIGIGHPGVKSEVTNWVLKKPAPEQRTAIEECVARTLKAVPAMLAGEMDKATLVVHTHKAPRRHRGLPVD